MRWLSLLGSSALLVVLLVALPAVQAGAVLPASGHTSAATFAGSGDASTATFSMSGPWTMSWHFDCASFGSSGNFIVNVNQPTSSLVVDAGPNELASSGSGTDYYYDTGSFSLGVVSECQWTIDVAPTAASLLSPTVTFTSSTTGSSGNTQQFATGGPWTMSWRYTCSQSGNFIVDVNQPASDTTFDIGPNQLGTGGSGVDSYSDAGVFNLSVESGACQWSITVSGPRASGYDLVGSDGGVFTFAVPGAGGFYGSLPGLGVHVDDIVGMVATSDDRGYFLVGSDGGVFAFGDAPYLGSLPALHVVPRAPIVGIVPTAGDRGYFLVGSDGGVFAFGDAPYLGSLPGLGIHRTDIVGIAATPSGNGYWLVAADGTVYAFGAARPLGSPGAQASPVSAIAGTPDGGGYWIATRNGGVDTFGDAGFQGSLPALGVAPVQPVIGIVPTTDLGGYWLIGADGGIFAFGDAGFVGSLPALGVHVTDIVGAVPTQP